MIAWTHRRGDMTSHDDRQGEDHAPRVPANAPLYGHERRAEDDHAGEEDPRDEPGKQAALEDHGDLLEEVGSLDLLASRAPGHVVREAVREDRLRDGDREAAEEEEAVEGDGQVVSGQKQRD